MAAAASERRHRADGDDGGADVDGCSLVDEDGADDAGEWRGQLDQRLGRLDLDQHVVDGNGVADGDLPLHDLGLGETFADVGEVEGVFTHGVPSVQMNKGYSA